MYHSLLQNVPKGIISKSNTEILTKNGVADIIFGGSIQTSGRHKTCQLISVLNAFEFFTASKSTSKHFSVCYGDGYLCVKTANTKRKSV